MLTTKLLHPEILRVLGRSGHGAWVLIADGNYPFGTTLGPNAELISLNLSPGVVSCTQVLQALLAAVPIEAAAVMQYAASGSHALAADPPIWKEFSDLLTAAGQAADLQRLERFAFYDRVRQPDVALTIATGEQRIYANLLLQIGVVAS